MRVLIDATSIPADRGGVGRYVEDLLPALAALPVELVVAAKPGDAERFAALVPVAEVVAVPVRVHRRPDRFHVAYHGVDTARFRPVAAADRRRVAAALGVEDGRYVGFLGTLEPRKNVPALVRGWTAAVRDLPDPPPLVLAGGAGWDDDVDPAIAAVPAHLRVVRPGYLPLDDLPAFLGGAQVVAYPSLGEGFGLPVLEAMACAATVLTTRELSLPEVGGDAVAYCGTGEREIAAGLAALLSDDALRARLAQAAQARAGEFTWAASAQAHLAAYRAVAGG